jgi:hypothetical protein
LNIKISQWVLCFSIKFWMLILQDLFLNLLSLYSYKYLNINSLLIDFFSFQAYLLFSNANFKFNQDHYQHLQLHNLLWHFQIFHLFSSNSKSLRWNQDTQQQLFQLEVFLHCQRSIKMAISIINLVISLLFDFPENPE